MIADWRLKLRVNEWQKWSGLHTYATADYGVLLFRVMRSFILECTRALWNKWSLWILNHLGRFRWNRWSPKRSPWPPSGGRRTYSEIAMVWLGIVELYSPFNRGVKGQTLFMFHQVYIGYCILINLSIFALVLFIGIKYWPRLSLDFTPQHRCWYRPTND